MEKHTFKISIDAPREKVWEILWSDATYPEWTSVFAEGSRAETDWKQGSKVLFLDGKGSGMVSVIEVKKAPGFLSFRHIGEVHNGVENIDTAWSGTHENYTLEDVDGRTDLSVEIDLTDEFKDYFLETFPRALDKVKAIAEKSTKEAKVTSY